MVGHAQREFVVQQHLDGCGNQLVVAAVADPLRHQTAHQFVAVARRLHQHRVETRRAAGAHQPEGFETHRSVRRFGDPFFTQVGGLVVTVVGQLAQGDGLHVGGHRFGGHPEPVFVVRCFCRECRV